MSRERSRSPRPQANGIGPQAHPHEDLPNFAGAELRTPMAVASMFGRVVGSMVQADRLDWTRVVCIFRIGLMAGPHPQDQDLVRYMQTQQLNPPPSSGSPGEHCLEDLAFTLAAFLREQYHYGANPAQDWVDQHTEAFEEGLRVPVEPTPAVVNSRDPQWEFWA